MIKDRHLEDYIHIWHDTSIAGPSARLGPSANTLNTSAVPNLPEPPHLSPERIYTLALPGGLAEAPAAELNHLSTCAACMTDWVFWSRVHAEDADDMTADPATTVSGGVLRAAASAAGKEALKLKSGCSRFLLSILPDMHRPDQGLIVVEAAGTAKDNWNEKTVSVRDAAGRTLLTGIMKNNSVARRIPNFEKIDLSAWTLVVQ